MIDEKNIRLQDLTTINKFCLSSQEKLHRLINYDKKKEINIYIYIFSKEETDQEAVEIRQKCEDYVLNINELQNQILIIKTPIRRVN